MNFLTRLLILRKVETENGLFLFSKDTDIHIAKGAKIIVKNGVLRAGYQIASSNPYAHYSKTTINLAENSTLIVNGDVNIGPGTAIVLNSGAKMTFGGANVIAHNNLFYCSKRIEIGHNTCTSWNCQFMDSDGHQIYSAKNGGQVLRPFYKPLMIGPNVGFQMNVVIPRGINIGSNALIGCNAILREDVKAESMVYVEQNLKIKEGIMTPYGKNLE